MEPLIAITGAAGFLGSALVWHLNRQGYHDLLLVDELGTGEKFRNLAGLRFSDYLEREELLERIVNNRELPPLQAVIHLGACSATTEDDGSYLMRNNFGYTRALAEWCLQRGVRFIYASSAATYGNGELGYADDEALIPRLRPMNKYAFSKQAFDLWALSHGALKSITGIKYFNVFGPNEYHKGGMRSMVLKAFEQVRDAGKVRLFRSYRPDYADGEQERDFIYVKDAVRVTAWFLEHPEATGIYNVGTGVARTWNELAHAVFAAMDRMPHIEYVEMPENIQKGYQYHTRAETSGLQTAGCPLPEYTLESAIYDYVREYLQQEDPYLKA